MAPPDCKRVLTLVFALTTYACGGDIAPRAARQPVVHASPRAVESERDVADRLLARTLRAELTAAGGSASPAHGFLVLHLPNDRLFETGRVDLSLAGWELVQRLVPLLGAVQAADVERPTLFTSGPVLITGYPTDWELSDARAHTLAEAIQTLDVDAQPKPMRAALRDAPIPEPARRVDIQVPASDPFQRRYFALDTNQ